MDRFDLIEVTMDNLIEVTVYRFDLIEVTWAGLTNRGDRMDRFDLIEVTWAGLT